MADQTTADSARAPEHPRSSVPAVSAAATPHIKGAEREPITFYTWFPGFCRRAFLWNAGVIGTLRGYVWALAYDDEYKAIVQGHRWTIPVIALVGTIVYARLTWLRRNEP